MAIADVVVPLSVLPLPGASSPAASGHSLVSWYKPTFTANLTQQTQPENETGGPGGCSLPPAGKRAMPGSRTEQHPVSHHSQAGASWILGADALLQ